MGYRCATPQQSHSRAVSLDTLASCAPCFVPSTVAKRILNPFRLGCKLFARHSANGGGQAFAPKAVRLKSHPPKAASKKKNHPVGWFFFLCYLDKIDAILYISDAFEAKTTILQLQKHNCDNSCRKRNEMIYFQFFFKQ